MARGGTSRSREPERADAVFAEDADLRAAAREAAHEGAAVLPDALEARFRERLRREVAACPFRPAPREVGRVVQETETHRVRALRNFPCVAALRTALARRLRAEGGAVPGLATWRPDEVVVQRYRPGSLGITAHRDGRRFRRLVAFVTVQGRARLRIQETREGGAVARLPLAPGTLALLRGPGLAGRRDGRPFHAVESSGSEERISVALRMEARRSRDGGDRAGRGPTGGSGR